MVSFRMFVVIDQNNQNLQHLQAIFDRLPWYLQSLTFKMKPQYDSMSAFIFIGPDPTLITVSIALTDRLTDLCYAITPKRVAQMT